MDLMSLLFLFVPAISVLLAILFIGKKNLSESDKLKQTIRKYFLDIGKILAAIVIFSIILNDYVAASNAYIVVCGIFAAVYSVLGIFLFSISEDKENETEEM